MSRRGIHPLLMGLDKPDRQVEDKPLEMPDTLMAGLESPQTSVFFVPRLNRNTGQQRMNEMTPTKLTNAPEGFEYYRVCDQEGVCHVVGNTRSPATPPKRPT